MVHVGKYYPRLFHRDLCGEFAQAGDNPPPKRWYISSTSGPSGTIPDWLHSHRPISYPGERDGLLQVIDWEWPAITGAPVTGFHARQSWDVAARTNTIEFDIYWSGGGHAHMTKTFSPMRAGYIMWTAPQGWTSSSTTDAAKWAWFSSTTDVIQMRPQPWPDEPNP